LEFKSSCLSFAGTRVKICKTIILPVYIGFSPEENMVDLYEENAEKTVLWPKTKEIKGSWKKNAQ
jgi:hypothetical protein